MPSHPHSIGNVASTVAARLSYKKKKGVIASNWSEHQTYDKAQQRAAHSAIYSYVQSKSKWTSGP